MHRPAAIQVERLLKVFGPNPVAARALVEQGRTRQEILDATGSAVAVNEVSFEVRRGELFVIMGLSGSGKSTVLRLLNRLIVPTGGSVRLDGHHLDTLSPPDLRQLRNRKISMVFQHYAIFPHRTVRQNVAYGLRLRGPLGEAEQQRVERALVSVGLAGLDDTYPSGLSGGMKQRVGIARALATDADIMLLDEPFSALDPLIRREMQDLLLQLHHELGRTIVFVTHDLNEAMRLGNRVLLMRDGGVTQLGTVNEILMAPADDYVARFVADVDRTRILRAADLVQPPLCVATIDDPLPELVARMNELGAEVTCILKGGRFAGTGSNERLRAALRSGSSRLLPSLCETGVVPADMGMSLAELCRLVEDGHPIAVVDTERRLVGVVTAGAIIAALGRQRVTAGPPPQAPWLGSP